VAAAAVAWLVEQRREDVEAPTLAELALGLFVVLAGLSFVFAPAGFGSSFGDFVGAGELAVLAYLTSRHRPLMDANAEQVEMPERELTGQAS